MRFSLAGGVDDDVDELAGVIMAGLDSVGLPLTHPRWAACPSESRTTLRLGNKRDMGGANAGQDVVRILLSSRLELILRPCSRLACDVGSEFRGWCRSLFLVRLDLLAEDLECARPELADMEGRSETGKLRDLTHLD